MGLLGDNTAHTLCPRTFVRNVALQLLTALKSSEASVHFHHELAAAVLGRLVRLGFAGSSGPVRLE